MKSAKPNQRNLHSATGPPVAAGKTRPAPITLSILLFVLTRWYILLVLNPQVSDVWTYFNYAVKAVDLHQTPYQGNLTIEYPPVAWWIISMPRHFDDRQITHLRDFQQVEPAFHEYADLFRALMSLCDLASLVFLLLIVRKRRPQMTAWAVFVYTLTTVALCHLLYDRLDVGLLMLLMFWAYSWTKSLEADGRAMTWTASAYALMGLSISYKIIPIICVPFLLLAEFNTPRRFARLTYALSALAAGALLPFAVQYTISGPEVFNLFQYHAGRGIQLESLYSTLMMIGSYFGSPIFISRDQGAYNLSGVLAPGMKILSTILLFGFLGGCLIWALFRRSRYGRMDAYRLACYIIPSSVIFANVLSPQYFIWAFPLLVLLAVEILPQGWLSPLILGACLVAVAAMTGWIFPYHYFCTELNPIALIPMNLADRLASSPIGYVVLGLRNFVYLGTVLWLGAALFGRGRTVEEPKLCDSGSIRPSFPRRRESSR